MKLLSIRSCGHDSNISYYDGDVVKYYKSEREYQEKHHGLQNVWEWRDIIKRVWNLDYRDLDEIAIIFEPANNNLPNEPKNFFPYLDYDLFPAPCPVYRLDHHLTHSLSSWMLTDKEPDVHIIIDGAGDSESDVPWSVIKNGELIDRGSLEEADSIGRLMVDMGDWMGFYRADDTPDGKLDFARGLDFAGKLMSLQNYGTVDLEFVEKLRKYGMREVYHIFQFAYWVEHKQDTFVAKHTNLDWLACVHYRIGELLVDFFKQYANKDDVIHYTGGVAQNIVWNTLLKKEFPNIIIPPHGADDGLSLGGIEFLRRKNNLPNLKLEKTFPYIQSDVAPEEPNEQIIKQAAQFLADGKIVSWYQGSGEVGPRALGNRSILMDPRISDGKRIINTVKNRENFRPFGASVLDEDKHKYFANELDDEFMLFTCDVIDDSLTAITHVDGTCRTQTVKNRNPVYRKLLEEFKELTGCSVLLNTSLNVNGKPIAGHPDDAGELFNSSPVDVLIIGNHIFQKDKS